MLKEEFKKTIKPPKQKPVFIGFSASEEEHASIKKAAKECGITIREYILNLHYFVQV